MAIRVRHRVPPDDSPEEHFADTVSAGDGLCNADAVRVMVDDGVTYVNSDAFSERHYMVITVWGDRQFRIKRVAF